MMVATTDGKTSIVSFETYFFSMSSDSPPRPDAGTLRRIKGSTATDRWQFGKRKLRFQFNFQEHDFGSGLVKHVVLHPGLAEVGLAEAELRLGAVPVRRHDGH